MFGKFGQNAAPARAVAGLHHGELRDIKKWLWKKIRLTQINIHFAYLLMQDNLKFLFYFTVHYAQYPTVHRGGHMRLSGGWVGAAL